MKITVGDEVIDIFEYDNEESLLAKYSLRLPDSIPSFFKIEDFKLIPETTLRVLDVRVLLKGKDLRELIDKDLDKLLGDFPLLRKKTIGILWITSNYEILPKAPYLDPSDIDLNLLKLLDKTAFATPVKITVSIREYEEDIKSLRDRIKTRMDIERDAFSKLDKMAKVPFDPFNLEGISFEFVIKTPREENIMTIFDCMMATKEIPFIRVITKKKEYFKVFEGILPPDIWIEDQEGVVKPPGIYFKILNIDFDKLYESKFTVRDIGIDKMYSNGFWSLENRIYINLAISKKVKEGEVPEVIIFERLRRNIDSSLKYQILTSHQIGIRGTYGIPDFDLNKYIFADFVSNDPVVKRFLYFDEGKITALSKDKTSMVIYYAPGHQPYGGAPTGGRDLTLTITPHIEKGRSSVTIRISRSTSIQQVSSAQLVLARLFGLYLANQDKIVKIYSDIIPKFKTLAEMHVRKEKEVKIDKKTGRRAIALREYDPKMFKERYPDQCQRHKHPYILSEDDAKKKAKDWKAKYGEDYANARIMPFNGAYYVCDPREKDDKDDRHVFPGLKTNVSEDKAYVAAYPCLPCCYIVDQRNKSIAKCIPGIKKSTKSGAGYVYKNKGSKEGRYGEVPFNWKKILMFLKIEKIVKGKQEFYPIVRYGVASTPDSVVHCMEKIFNEDYSSSTEEDKNIIVMETRKSIADSNLAFGKQELYGYSDEEIRATLKNPDAYIAPENFMSLLERKYRCNIFIFVVDKANPDSTISLPRASHGYLFRDIDVTRPSVIIMKYEVFGERFPFQCEVVCQTEDNTPIFTFDTKSKLIRLITSMLYKSNEVFITSPTGYEYYVPGPSNEV